MRIIASSFFGDTSEDVNKVFADGESKVGSVGFHGLERFPAALLSLRVQLCPEPGLADEGHVVSNHGVRVSTRRLGKANLTTDKQKGELTFLISNDA